MRKFLLHLRRPSDEPYSCTDVFQVLSELLEAVLHDKINNVAGTSLVENWTTIGGLQGLLEEVDGGVVGRGIVERRAKYLLFDAVKFKYGYHRVVYSLDIV